MEMEALKQKILEAGATKVGAVAVKDIQFDQGFRAMCESNACGNYGKCYTCPPDCGDIQDLIQRLQGYETALVYQTISPLEDSYDFEGMMEAGAKHNQLTNSLTQWFKENLDGAFYHVGAGGCRLCQRCGKLTGEPCRHPDLAIPSLEAHGVNVSELAAAAGMNYINGQNTVTYFGAVFLK
jgi:predicted metal-binding protein